MGSAREWDVNSSPGAVEADTGPEIEPVHTAAVRKAALESNAPLRPSPLGRGWSAARSLGGPVWLIAVLLLVTGLYFARTFVLPVVLAVLLSLVLGPTVRRLERFVPAPVGAAALLLAFGLALAAIGSQVAPPAQKWIDGLPGQVREIGVESRNLLARFQSYRSLAEEVEELTDPTPAKDGVLKVEVKTEPSLSAMTLQRVRYSLGLLAASTVLLYFLLAGRNTFLIRLARFSPDLKGDAAAPTLLRRLERQVSRYFLTVTLINSGLGVAIGLTVAALGVGNPVLWGVLAALLNFIPYVGALVGVSLLALSSVLTGDSAVAMVLPPLAYAALTAVEGTMITPAILGRRFALSPVVILLSLFFWGWLWGVPGAFLAVPVLVVVRIVAEYFPGLESLRSLMDRGSA